MSGFQLQVPAELVDAIADAVVDRLDTSDVLRHARLPDPWLDVDQAADHLACKPQRIYDLVNQRRLRRVREGRRLLFKRSWLDEILDDDTDQEEAQAA